MNVGLCRMVHCEDIVVFLLLTLFTGAQSQVFGPRQVVVATVGDDVVLPCQLDPPQDAVSMTIEWARPDLTPRFVHVWYGRQDLLIDQNEAYKGRTSLSTNMMEQGDVSLRLSTVKISDTGKYRCYFPKLKREHFVDLLVGSASAPVVTLTGIDEATGGVILRCESGGWYPQPELLWLDSEGHLLLAGPPETLRGPDDLYTVSSRVTVEKRGSITCRVQQKETNQIRETQILVSEDFFKSPSISTLWSVLAGVLGFLLLLSAGLLVWDWKQNKTEIQKIKHQQYLMEEDLLRENERVKEELLRETDRSIQLNGLVFHSDRVEQQLRRENQRMKEELLTEIQRMKEELLTENQRMKEELLRERKRVKELEKKEEELKDITLGSDALMKMMKTMMKEQKEKVSEQMNKTDELVKENEEKVTSLEEEVEKKGENKSLGQNLKH